VRAPALLSLLAIGCLAGGCSPSQRALGEECLKDQDCLSGICSQLQCAAEPPLLDGAASAPSADGALSEAGAFDASARPDGSDEEASMNEGTVAEAEAGGAATDASSEAPTEASDAASSDSATASAQDSNPAGD
jgi:hypothetical protein